MKIISNTATEIVFEAEETPREYHITPARETGTLAASYPIVEITLSKENVQELAKKMGLL